VSALLAVETRKSAAARVIRVVSHSRWSRPGRQYWHRPVGGIPAWDSRPSGRWTGRRL